MHIYAGSTNALTTNVKTKCIAENRPKRNGKGTEEVLLHSFGRGRVFQLEIFKTPTKVPGRHNVYRIEHEYSQS